MKKNIFILIIITFINFGCSKIRNDASMLLCTSLETNPNFNTFYWNEFQILTLFWIF